MNKIQENLFNFGIILILFSPLVVTGFTLYPFVYGKSVLFYIIAIVFLYLIIELFFSKSIIISSKNKIPLLLLILYLVYFVSSFFGADFYKSFWGNFERMNGLLFYSLTFITFITFVIYLDNDKKWRNTLMFLLVSNLAVCFFVITQWLGIDIGGINTAPGRISGTFGNAAYLSSYLTINLILGLYAYFKYEDLKTLSIFALTFNSIIILLSATRASVLAIAFSIFIFLIIILINKNFNKLLKISAGIFLLISIILAGLLFSNKNSQIIVSNNLLSRIANMQTDEAVINRLKAWSYSIEAFKKRPILGYGIDNYNIAFNEVYDSGMSEQWFDRAHNTYLDILVMSGIIGLIAYLALVFYVFYIINKLLKDEKIGYNLYLVFLLGFIAYLVQNIFIFDMINSYLAFLMFLSLLVYLGRDNNKNLKKIGIENRLLRTFSLPVIFVLCVLMFYFFAVKPTMANINAVKSIQSLQNSNDSKALLEKALNYKTYGELDILYNWGEKVADEIEIEGDTKNRDYAIEIFEKYNAEDKIRLALLLSVFYNARSLEDPSYTEKTIELMEMVLQDNPGRQDVYYQLARAYALDGQNDKAIELFKKALALNDDKIAYYNIVVAELYMQNQEEAQRLFLEMMEKNRDDVSITELTNIFNGFVQLAHWEGVRDVLLEMIKKEEVGDYYLTLARVYDKLGEDKLANEALSKSFELDPSIQDKVMEDMKNANIE